MELGTQMLSIRKEAPGLNSPRNARIIVSQDSCIPPLPAPHFTGITKYLIFPVRIGKSQLENDQVLREREKGSGQQLIFFLAVWLLVTDCRFQARAQWLMNLPVRGHMSWGGIVCLRRADDFVLLLLLLLLLAERVCKQPAAPHECIMQPLESANGPKNKVAFRISSSEVAPQNLARDGRQKNPLDRVVCHRGYHGRLTPKRRRLATA